MKYDELLSAMEQPGPKLSEAELAEFERQIGHALPVEYRAFLLACNGGYTEQQLNYYDYDEEEDVEYEETVNFFCGLRNDIDGYSLSDNWVTFRRRIPKDFLAIIVDCFGNLYCLGLAGSTRGNIYFWDHESELENGRDWDGSVETAENVGRMAESFSKFVDLLEFADEDDDEDE